MALLIGAIRAFAAGLLATTTGLDRDRAFHPTVTMVITSQFAVMGASAHLLVLESLAGAVFLGVARVAHGPFDLVNGRAMANPGVPGWWPVFCLTFDVAAAAYLAWLLESGRIHAAT